MTSPCESRVGDATLAGPGGRKLGLRRVRRAKIRVGTAGPIFRGPRKGRADSRREFPPRAKGCTVTVVLVYPIENFIILDIEINEISSKSKPVYIKYIEKCIY